MKIKSILLAFLMLGMVNHAWSARVILTQGYFDAWAVA